MVKELKSIKASAIHVERADLKEEIIRDCLSIEEFDALQCDCIYVRSTNEYYKKPGNVWMRLSPNKLATLDSIKKYIDEKFSEIDNHLKEFASAIVESKDFMLNLQSYVEKKLKK